MKDRLIALLRERSVRFGTFTLASGKESDFYVDARQTTLHPEGASIIAGLILHRLHPGVTAVGGPVTGADPIVGATVLLSWQQQRPVQGFMVRKATKGHGTGNLIEGVGTLESGAKVCVVEDTVTTGGSLLTAIGNIEDRGYQVAQCITVVDREEGAQQRLAEAGYTLEALVTRKDLEQA